MVDKHQFRLAVLSSDSSCYAESRSIVHLSKPLNKNEWSSFKHQNYSSINLMAPFCMKNHDHKDMPLIFLSFNGY